MKAININFPDSITIDNNRPISIYLEKPFENIITINQIDYVPYYLDNLNPGNKGGNSHVLKLVRAEDFEEDNYPEESDIAIKICRFWKSKYREHKRSSLFANEILALLKCNSEHLSNIMNVLSHGLASVSGLNGRRNDYRFYAMPFAQFDLSGYLAERNPSYSERIDLCIEICHSLSQIWSIGYYHRDIKPDNILFTDTQWVLSDLGLAVHREQDTEKHTKYDWVRPRGWMSPESMNRFLAAEMPWSSLFDKKIDHQSDIYQLGKVFWYVLQGNAPEGAIKREDFRWNDDHLYQILLTMLYHNKNSRYKKIELVIDDLKKVSQRALIGGEPSPLY